MLVGWSVGRFICSSIRLFQFAAQVPVPEFLFWNHTQRMLFNLNGKLLLTTLSLTRLSRWFGLRSSVWAKWQNNLSVKANCNWRFWKTWNITICRPLHCQDVKMLPSFMQSGKPGPLLNPIRVESCHWLLLMLLLLLLLLPLPRGKLQRTQRNSGFVISRSWIQPIALFF